MAVARLKARSPLLEPGQLLLERPEIVDAGAHLGVTTDDELGEDPTGRFSSIADPEGQADRLCDRMNLMRSTASPAWDR